MFLIEEVGDTQVQLWEKVCYLMGIGRFMQVGFLIIILTIIGISVVMEGITGRLHLGDIVIIDLLAVILDQVEGIIIGLNRVILVIIIIEVASIRISIATAIPNIIIIIIVGVLHMGHTGKTTLTILDLVLTQVVVAAERFQVGVVQDKVVLVGHHVLHASNDSSLLGLHLLSRVSEAPSEYGI